MIRVAHTWVLVNSPQRSKDSWIPLMLLESAGINRLDTPINAVDRYLPRTKTNNRTQPLMSSLDGPIILHPEALPEHPDRRDRHTPVRIRDLSQRRQERRVYNSLEENDGGSEHRYRARNGNGHGGRSVSEGEIVHSLCGCVRRNPRTFSSSEGTSASAFR